MSDPFADALELQRAAAAEGFDWKDPAGLWEKLAEEVGELRAAEGFVHREEELGDLLFMVVNLARHFGLDPAGALRSANAKFERRYGFVVRHTVELPPIGDPARLVRMEALWQAAKRLEKNPENPNNTNYNSISCKILLK